MEEEYLFSMHKITSINLPQFYEKKIPKIWASASIFNWKSILA